MNKEETLKKLTEAEKDIVKWQARVNYESDAERKKSATLDLQRVERAYSKLLIGLNDDECKEIKEYAQQQGVKLDLFDKYNIPEEEKIKSREAIAQFDRVFSDISDSMSADPEFVEGEKKMFEDMNKSIEGAKKEKKGIFGGLFGKK